VEARARVLHDVYARAIGRQLYSKLEWVSEGVGLWALDDRPLQTASRTVWGTTVLPNGGLDDVLEHGADLPGVWVIAGVRPGGLRLVSSPVVMHTLVRAEGRAAEAFATRGLAAVVLAGREPRVAWERVAEWVFFDYVLGDEELLDGVEVLDEAALIDLDQGRASVRSWSPRSERWAPGPATRVEDVHHVVAHDARRLTGLPGARLGLTAGRDSALVARMLPADAPTFTIGWVGNPDSDAAAVRARELGLAHEIATVSPARLDEGFESLVRLAAWQEGIENPRTVAVGPLAWDARDVLWLTGHGGELARAFYWPDGPPPTIDAAVELLMRPTDGLSAASAGHLRERLMTQLEELAEIRSDPAAVLDLFYAAGRMHKWLGRILPYEQITAFAPTFLAPQVVRALLDLPREARQLGQVFGPPAPAVAVPAMTFRERLARKLRGRGDWPLLRPLVDERPHPQAVEALGESWWQSTLTIARHHDWAQQWTWNVLATEALNEQLSRLNLELART
jgi:hypothetical protein